MMWEFNLFTKCNQVLWPDPIFASVAYYMLSNSALDREDLEDWNMVVE